LAADAFRAAATAFRLARSGVLAQRFRVKRNTTRDHRLLSTLLVIGLALAAKPMKAAEPDFPALKLLNAKRTLIIGHRGYPQFAPENTIPSWKLAIEAGADMAELDYYHTKDGQLVVMHDGTLDRTTDATNRWGGKKISVTSKTVAELKTLDAGSWFDAKYAGTKVPLLSEALDFIQGNGGVTLIERKEGDAGTCVKMLREKKLINQVVVQAFDWQYLKAFHEIEPQQVLGALGPPNLLPDGTPRGDRPKALSAAWIDEVLKCGAKAAVWNDQVSREAVDYAHKRGLKVWVYTINDPTQANKLLDLGVDGLITNNTGLMWKTVALRPVM
jgi:glycerophosphoryl diester phosphodiesterase